METAKRKRGRPKIHGDASKGVLVPEYSAWCRMLERCRRPTHPSWPNYGGRGITVCARWESYQAFLADMGRRPSAGHSLERINNDLGYSPENCRWATREEQQRNKRTNRLITAFGQTKSVTEWAEQTAIPVSRLRRRLEKWRDPERALTEERKT